MGERDQHQHGRTENEREDAEIEKGRGSRRHGADQRQFDIAGIRGQEGVSEQPGGREIGTNQVEGI